MDSELQLSFRYVESDYVKALRAHYASRLRLRTDVFVVVMLVGIGAYLWTLPATRWLGAIGIVLGLGFAGLLCAAFTILPVLVFRREPKLRDEYSLVFSAEGIHYRTAHIDSQIEWNLYSRALVDAHSYLLYYGSRQFTVIPKRVFGSPEQQEAFEQLLTRHVPRIARRKG